MVRFFEREPALFAGTVSGPSETHSHREVQRPGPSREALLP